MKPDELKDLSIAVIGAGYGGAATAKALSLLGADVTVYERASAIREVGAGIGLRPATLNLFRQWGIFDAIAQVSSASDYFQILTPTGSPIAQEPWPGSGDYAVETKTRLIHRGDFIDALIGVLPDGMVQIGHRLTGIADHGDGATLTFANGKQVDADLVVGADGIHSVVRKELFSDAEPVFSGEHAYRVVIDVDATYGLAVDDNFRMYIGRGTKVYFLPLRHRGQVSFDVTALCPDPTWAPNATKDDLLTILEGFDERIVHIVRDLDMEHVNVRAVYDMNPIDRWHSACVALVGDAAHAMLHHQGQGANQAVQDAGGLVDALLAAPDLPSALARYQEIRKPVTDVLQAVSRQGWDEDEVDDVFPGQKTAAAGRA